MSVTITVVQRQRKIKIDVPALKRHAAALAERAQAAAPAGPAWHEVVIHLLDDRQMREVNRAVMRHEGATDVITQRYDPVPGEPGGLIGELFVDVEWAVRKAPARKGWGAGRELLLYVAHGCDHLTGADDQTPEGRRRMRRRELRWLRALTAEPAFLRGGPRTPPARPGT